MRNFVDNFNNINDEHFVHFIRKMKVSVFLHYLMYIAREIVEMLHSQRICLRVGDTPLIIC